MPSPALDCTTPATSLIQKYLTQSIAITLLSNWNKVTPRPPLGLVHPIVYQSIYRLSKKPANSIILISLFLGAKFGLDFLVLRGLQQRTVLVILLLIYEGFCRLRGKILENHKSYAQILIEMNVGVGVAPFVVLSGLSVTYVKVQLIT